MGQIIVAGIGPGSPEDITPAVLQAIGQADVIVGYKYYFQFIEPYMKEGCECIDTGMKRERAEQAFMLAGQDKTVVVISSGDAGLYGMAPLVYEMKCEEAKCYLSDPRVAEMASSLGITRTQAGIRLAVEEHPDALFAFGNAPTALMELCDLIRKGKARPAGIIAAPVGFVHVRESKHMVKPFRDIPKIIVEGRKGGSNLAATLCNAILTFDDAAQLKSGRDL